MRTEQVGSGGASITTERSPVHRKKVVRWGLLFLCLGSIFFPFETCCESLLLCNGHGCFPDTVLKSFPGGFKTVGLKRNKPTCTACYWSTLPAELRNYWLVCSCHSTNRRAMTPPLPARARPISGTPVITSIITSIITTGSAGNDAQGNIAMTPTQNNTQFLRHVNWRVSK